VSSVCYFEDYKTCENIISFGHITPAFYLFATCIKGSKAVSQSAQRNAEAQCDSLIEIRYTLFITLLYPSLRPLRFFAHFAILLYEFCNARRRSMLCKIDHHLSNTSNPNLSLPERSRCGNGRWRFVLWLIYN